jgi:hypothetical protein
LHINLFNGISCYQLVLRNSRFCFDLHFLNNKIMEYELFDNGDRVQDLKDVNFHTLSIFLSKDLATKGEVNPIED